ncbi:hypothetical protein [Sphingobacterium detergens]|uniref:Uncharacterized protein n=1 Tax=Sphingobacterium detergens TaxID=1145106 RepID=A0A420BKI1_SPHD1|nr:hypothetical protein [Sphingobacterium detergens]RKE57291.1 hypothetical protein DFQ12_2178 [Sphingobacterium detergens]
MSKKNVEKIRLLVEKIKDWNRLNDDELFQLIKEFEKMPRLEVSKFYNDLFNDAKLVENLLTIYDKHSDNTKLVVLLISSIGNMIQRYRLPETKAIYEFMLKNSYRKNVGAYVALFLPRLTSFETYNNKWKYIMDIKMMSPKKIAESAFEALIGLYIDNIPAEYKVEASNYFKSKAQKSNNEYGKQYYLDLASKIK